MHIGCSTWHGKEAIQQWVWNRYKAQSTILDIGAGGGSYSDLLGAHNYIIDAVEIYPPAIPFIINKYHTIFNVNIIDFQFLHDYDLIIMGDVLEHLTPEEGQTVLKIVLQHCKQVIVAVPFKYWQDTIEDNIHEKHLQDDLDFDIMKERYPELELLLYIEDKTITWSDDAGRPFSFKYAYYIAKGALYNE